VGCTAGRQGVLADIFDDVGGVSKRHVPPRAEAELPLVNSCQGCGKVGPSKRVTAMTAASGGDSDCVGEDGGNSGWEIDDESGVGKAF